MFERRLLSDLAPQRLLDHSSRAGQEEKRIRESVNICETSTNSRAKRQAQTIDGWIPEIKKERLTAKQKRNNNPSGG